MRTAPEALLKSRKIRGETKDGAELMQASDVPWPQNNATSRDDDRELFAIEFVERAALLFAKLFFSQSSENLGNRHAQRGRDHLIGIEARPAGRAGQSPADRRLASAHETDQDDRAVRSAHTVICGVCARFQVRRRRQVRW